MVIDESYNAIKSPWFDKLVGVDLFSRSHVSTMLNFVRWND